MRDSFSEMRRRNAVRVLDLIRHNGELSRAEIARLTDLSKATVSSIASELLDNGLVSETGSLSTQKGRKPTGLIFNPLARFSCGLSVDDQRRTSVAIVDMDGNTLHQSSSAGLEWSADHVVDFLRATITAAGLDISRLCSLGLAVPGPVRGQDSKPFFDLTDELASRLGVNVELASLVDMAAVAEASAEKLAGDGLALFVRTSHGLRSSLLSGSKLLKIHAEVGGDLGHMLAPWIHESCPCGNVGCVNTHVGNEFVLRRARGLNSSVSSLAELVEKAKNGGDEVCVKVAGEAGYATGYAIATMMNAFAPITIIVSGLLASIGDVFWNPLREACQKFAAEDNFNACRVKCSVLGPDAHCVGAAQAALAHASVFKD